METSWRRFTTYFRTYPSVGLSLDISRMSFDEPFLTSLATKTQAAFEDMAALERGAIANPDEKRMVGHYWLRNPELSPQKSIAEAVTTAVSMVREFARDVHSGKIKTKRQENFENVLLLGIGGSALGPQLLADALWDPSNKMKMFFCDNTDPDGIERLLQMLGPALARTLVIVISKSGGTKETRNSALLVAEAFAKKQLHFPDHAIAVTCEKSLLDVQAQKESWLRVFPLWDWVGGRTSIFSLVGLLPAALQGIPVDSFLEGARKMDDLTRIPDALNNPAMLLALMWFAAGDGKGKRDMVVLPYKDRLVLFSKYLQQLVMESLGKEKDLQGNIVHQGIAVYGNKGSTDQHAYIQQLRDGIPNFFVTFIEVLSELSDLPSQRPDAGALEVEPGVTAGDYLSGFFQGTRKALFENGRQSMTITLDRLNAESLGALIALYERAVGFYASLVGINAYHQPGVEAGKKAAGQVIEKQRTIYAALRKSQTAQSAEELSKQIVEPDIETVYKVLEHLAANARTKIQRSGPRGPLTSRYQFVIR